jgi:hypothetical protein
LYRITNDKANLFDNAGWLRIDAEERGLLDAANCRAMFCHSDWYRDLIARSFCSPAAPLSASAPGHCSSETVSPASSWIACRSVRSASKTTRTRRHWRRSWKGFSMGWN